MKFNDEWTEGLSSKQQNLIIEYVLNECKIKSGMAGYANVTSMKKFLKSEKGRKAIRKYVEFQLDVNSDTVKLRAVKLMLEQAFFNPADIIDINGNFIKVNKDGREINDLRDLGPLSFCVDAIESEIIGTDPSTGKTIKKIKIKLCDRHKALDFIKQAFNIFEKDNDELPGEKNIFEMSDEERDAEIERLLKDTKLIEKKGENKNVQQKESD